MTFQITDEDGDIYEATRPTSADPWTITFPTGETRFYGTRAEAEAEIARLIAETRDAEIGGIIGQRIDLVIYDEIEAHAGPVADP